jgi:Flp pilus assembly protein TadD
MGLPESPSHFFARFLKTGVLLNPSLRRIAVTLVVLAAVVPISIRADQETGLSDAAKNAGDAYLRALQQAGAAYQQQDYAKALAKLDIADQVQQNIPDTWNMRGAIYAQEHDFDKAEDAFEMAGKLNPGDFWPQYNVAELMLMQKQYGQAVTAFQRLSVYGGHEELVQFKIVFASLLEGKKDVAKPVLDAMKFPCDTPAYYFAHAAWGYASGDNKNGNYFARWGIKVFGVPQCAAFYDALAGAGWVPARTADGSVPDSAELTKPDEAPGSDLLNPHVSLGQ